MEDFEYFEVCKLPSLLEPTRLIFEDFDEVENLRFGDCLDSVELLEKIEHLLYGIVVLLLLVFVSGLHRVKSNK